MWFCLAPAFRDLLAASLLLPHTCLLTPASAQVLAQALSEGDLVPPSELASLHTYDLVKHLSQVRYRMYSVV